MRKSTPRIATELDRLDAPSARLSPTKTTQSSLQLLATLDDAVDGPRRTFDDEGRGEFAASSDGDRAVGACALIDLLTGGRARTTGLVHQQERSRPSLDPLVADFLGGGGGGASDGTLAPEIVDGPVARIVEEILHDAVRSRASDVHIEPRGSNVHIRMRVDGALGAAFDLPIAIAPALVSRIKILAGMNIVERRRPQDGQLSSEIDGRVVDVRVATVATIDGEKCVLRVLDKSRPLLRLRELGMSPETAESFANAVRQPFGMVLCAGPTGSGKTTTLYATLGEIADPSKNVMTIEDPVEYRFDTINQIPVSEASGMTFANGLRSILRQDPDVILVGEIRDAEAARIAIQSALTGHFVLSSVHATDAVAALHRFLDMGIEPFLVAPSLIAVIGQRLVRRVCERCAAPTTPSREEQIFYERCGGDPSATLLRGAGCEYCDGTGFRDRIGVYELLRVTPDIRQLVVDGSPQDEIRVVAQRQGMRTLQKEAVGLVAQGLTTVAEVMRVLYLI